jgi:DNA-nicking Smr family endonuclease
MMCPRDEDLNSGPEPLPMDGVLDLHMFPPREVKELVPVWLEECRRLGLREVRIIHGKGIGVLREIVYGILDKDEGVESYRHPSDRGSWGATVVRLRATEEMDGADGS